MRHLRLKWKFFYGMNVFVAVIILVLLGISVKNMLLGRFQAGINEAVLLILYWLGEISLIVNNLVNLHTITKYFPDKIVSQKIDKLSTYLFFINIIALMLLVPQLLSGISDLYKAENLPGRKYYISLMYFYLFTLCLQAFNLIVQIRLPGIINRNNRKKIQSIVESIGTEQHN